MTPPELVTSLYLVSQNTISHSAVCYLSPLPLMLSLLITNYSCALDLCRLNSHCLEGYIHRIPSANLHLKHCQRLCSICLCSPPLPPTQLNQPHHYVQLIMFPTEGILSLTVTHSSVSCYTSLQCYLSQLPLCTCTMICLICTTVDNSSLCITH